jgi:hypothetical protein
MKYKKWGTFASHSQDLPLYEKVQLVSYMMDDLIASSEKKGKDCSRMKESFWILKGYLYEL